MDYLKQPLRSRLAKRQKDPGNFILCPMAAGGIWTNLGKPVHRDTDGTVHDSNLGGHGLRLVGSAHSILPRLRHNGWFTDSLQDSVCFGIVYRLTRSRGFLAGYSDPWNSEKDGSGPHNLDLSAIYKTAEDAARAGDDMAERYAKRCMEDDEEHQAEQQIEQEREDIQSNRERFRKLIAGLRDSKLAPAVCDEIRASLRRIRREIRESGARIRELQASPWKAVA